MNLFKQHKYLIIRNAISFELANFAFNYFLMKRDATEWMHKNNYISEFTPIFPINDGKLILSSSSSSFPLINW